MKMHFLVFLLFFHIAIKRNNSNHVNCCEHIARRHMVSCDLTDKINLRNKAKNNQQLLRNWFLPMFIFFFYFIVSLALFDLAKESKDVSDFFFCWHFDSFNKKINSFTIRISYAWIHFGEKYMQKEPKHFIAALDMLDTLVKYLKYHQSYY